MRSMQSRLELNFSLKQQQQQQRTPHSPSGHAEHSAPEDGFLSRTPGGASTRGSLTCPLRRHRRRGPKMSVQFPPHAKMLSAPPHALPPLRPSRPSVTDPVGRREPAAPGPTPRAGEPSGRPLQGLPSSWFHRARVRTGSSAARGTLHVANSPSSPPLCQERRPGVAGRLRGAGGSDAGPASRLGTCRPRRARQPNAVPAPEGHRKARTLRHPAT